MAQGSVHGAHPASLQQEGGKTAHRQAHHRGPGTVHAFHQKGPLALDGVGPGLVGRFAAAHIGAENVFRPGMEADGAGETRLTFTFASLQDARLLVLHIEGQGKRDVLAAARADGPEEDMPIRAVLRRAATPVDIYWAP